MKKSLNWLGAMAGISLLTLSFPIASPTPALAATLDDTTTLRMTYYSSHPDFNPGDGGMLSYNTQEGLMRYNLKDPNGGVVYGLADSYQISGDGKTYTFHLRTNAKWNDGSPIVAGDFVTAYQRLKQNTHLDADQMLNEFHITNIAAIDDHTVQVTFSSPGSDLIKVFGSEFLVPVETSLVNAQGAQFGALPQDTSFSGPFVVQEVTSDHLLLTKNPNYWDATNVALNRVELFLNLSPQDAARLYELGILDIAGIGNTNGIFFSNEENAIIHPADEKFLVLNAQSQTSPLRDANIRKALQLALPTDPYGEFSVNGFVPNAIAGVSQSFRGEHPYSFQSDPQAAKTALAAGLKDLNLSQLPPLELEEDTDSDLSWLANCWNKELGIQVNVVQHSGQELTDLYNSGQTQIAELNWSADYNDPADFLDVFQSKDGFYKTDYQNQTFDSDLAAAAATADPTKRLNELAQAEQTLLNDKVVIPLYQEAFDALVHPYVQAANLGWTDMYDFKATSKTSRPVLSTQTFADDNQIPAYSKPSIDHLLNTEIVHGTDPQHFSPQQTVTRAEFVAMLVKALGLPAQESDKQFSDLSNQDWSYPYVQTAVANGILHGYQTGSTWLAKPNAPITRAEMATLLDYALHLPAASQANSFTDINGNWAKSHILAAQNAGLLSGYQDHTFGPDKNAIRADAACVVDRALNKMALPPLDPALF